MLPRPRNAMFDMLPSTLLDFRTASLGDGDQTLTSAIQSGMSRKGGLFPHRVLPVWVKGAAPVALPALRFMQKTCVGDGNGQGQFDFLLSPAKRNQVVELWEVEKFGRDSFGDPDAVALYGMRPAEWYDRGVRILARTALEAVRDPLGNRIGADVARVAAMTPQGTLFGVVDCFAGSC